MSETVGSRQKYDSEISESSDIGSVYDWVSDTARENPALVVGGALAAGALVAMLLVSRKPESRARAVERRISRELNSMEKALRRQRPISAASDRLADVTASLMSTLSTMDAGTLRGALSRAGDLSSQVSRRLGL